MLALLAGLFVGLIAVIIWMTQAYNGFGAAFFSGIFVAGAAWLVVFGIAGLAQKKLPTAAHLGILGGLTVLATLAGPSISNAYNTSSEATLWAKLSKSSTSSFEWSKYETQVPSEFQRPEWRNAFLLAKVHEAKGNAKALRDVLQTISTEPKPKVVKGARAAATKELEALYDAGKARLYAAPTSGSTPEFPVDEGLRRGFGAMLATLTDSNDPNVYVAFTSSSALDAPKGTDVALKEYQSDPEIRRTFPKGDVPVIDAGKAFSAEFDQRRRSTFMSAMSESFAKIFDSQLVTLVPLEKGADRKGKVVIEVSSKITRQPDFFIYSTEVSPGDKRVAGLLFAIDVEWQFKIVDREGKTLYEASPQNTKAAERVHISRGENDPQWALYSIMMDSAYYNYSREVVGRFGFEPPPVKDTFTYAAN